MHRRECCVDCADPASCQAMDDCVLELAKLIDNTYAAELDRWSSEGGNGTYEEDDDES